MPRHFDDSKERSEKEFQEQYELDSQLDIPEPDISGIGFSKKHFAGDEMNSPRDYYEIGFQNGFFYYNPSVRDYKWYQKITNGNCSVHTHLSIIKREELFLLLSMFQVKFACVY